MWNSNYEDLLHEWVSLRYQCEKLPLGECLSLINDWWFNAPIINSYYHITDPDHWPTPWELLLEDGFDDFAKSLGMCYTLLLLQRNDLESIVIKQSDNYVIVHINDKYILNDDPEVIINECENYKFIYDCSNLKL